MHALAMIKRQRFRVFVLGLATLTIGIWGLTISDSAKAGHTILTGDCWQSGTPIMCRTNWQGQNTSLYLRIDDQVTPSASWLTPAMDAAITSWNTANGPQVVSKSPISSPETWTYYYWSNTGSWGLTSNTSGVAWICDTSGFCTNAPTQGMNIFKANIFLNSSVVTSSRSAFANQGTIAHEFGHAIGLFHHDSNTAYLMYGTASTRTVNGPVEGDLGSFPPCGGGSTSWGVRCIYRWSLD